MREFEIIDHSGEKKDVRGAEVSAERLSELYPDRENRAFWKFVHRIKQDGRSEFAVSRAVNKYENDPSLLFFRAGEPVDGKRPIITFLGKNVARGSIEIWNRFAAETYGFSVLALGEQAHKKKTRL